MTHFRKALLAIIIITTLSFGTGTTARADQKSGEPTFSRTDLSAMLTQRDLTAFQAHLPTLLPFLLETVSQGALSERLAAEAVLSQLGAHAVDALVAHYSQGGVTSLGAIAELVRLGAQLRGCANQDAECAEGEKKLGAFFLKVLEDEHELLRHSRSGSRRRLSRAWTTGT
jgi:hypothetical protein